MKKEILELIEAPWSSYDEAKARSEKIDELLGLQVADCETQVRLRDPFGDSQQDWSWLSPQSFQTPYPELAEIIRHMQGEQALRWVDLGTAYGRLGFVLQAMRPQDQFLGLEWVIERVREGSRVLQLQNCTRARLEQSDLTDAAFTLPEADVFFLFDFSRPDAIAKLLEQLQERAKRKPLTLIGRGRATRHLIADRHPWLSVVDPIHTQHWSLYRSHQESPGG